MGLFNHIVPGPYCPSCGGDLDWQSKELYVRDLQIAKLYIEVSLSPDMSGEAHAGCYICELWYEARIECGVFEIVWSAPVGAPKPRVKPVGKRYFADGKYGERT